MRRGENGEEEKEEKLDLREGEGRNGSQKIEGEERRGGGKKGDKGRGTGKGRKREEGPSSLTPLSRMGFPEEFNFDESDVPKCQLTSLDHWRKWSELKTLRDFFPQPPALSQSASHTSSFFSCFPQRQSPLQTVQGGKEKKTGLRRKSGRKEKEVFFQSQRGEKRREKKVPTLTRFRLSPRPLGSGTNSSIVFTGKKT